MGQNLRPSLEDLFFLQASVFAPCIFVCKTHDKNRSTPQGSLISPIFWSNSILSYLIIVQSRCFFTASCLFLDFSRDPIVYFRFPKFLLVPRLRSWAGEGAPKPKPRHCPVWGFHQISPKPGDFNQRFLWIFDGDLWEYHWRRLDLCNLCIL